MTAKREYGAIEVARAARRLDLALAEMHLDVAHRMDMTHAELLAIAHLAVEEDLSPGDLARRLHLRSGAITAMLDRLAAHGHITRAPHPTDRRKLVVALTDSGRHEAMRHLGPMVADVVALVRRLSTADRETVGRFIDQLAEVVAHRSTAAASRRGPGDGPAAIDGEAAESASGQRARAAT